MKARLYSILILLLVASFGLQGCNLLRKRVESREKVSYTFNSTGKVKFSVRNVNGEIKVSKRLDSLAVINVEAEKIARVRYDEKDKPLDNVRINIDTTGSEVNISTEEPKVNFGLFNLNEKAKINFVIKVPANMRVEVNSVNGTVSLSGLDGTVKSETVNGLTLLNRCTGELDINAVNGQIKGNIDTVRSLNVDVVNGRITLGGLRNVSAKVDASTVNGKIKFTGLNFTNLESERKTLTGTLGSGKANIKLSSVNGSVTMNANDVNLGGKNDEDFDFRINFDDDDYDAPNVEKKLKDTEKKLNDVQKNLQESKPADTNKAK